MTFLLTFSILMAPVVVAVMLGWSAHRRDGLRVGLDQFGFDAPRMRHELDAIRTRFEEPTSGALGGRR